MDTSNNSRSKSGGKIRKKTSAITKVGAVHVSCDDSEAPGATPSTTSSSDTTSAEQDLVREPSGNITATAAGTTTATTSSSAKSNDPPGFQRSATSRVRIRSRSPGLTSRPRSKSPKSPVPGRNSPGRNSPVTTARSESPDKDQNNQVQVGAVPSTGGSQQGKLQRSSARNVNATTTIAEAADRISPIPEKVQIGAVPSSGGSQYGKQRSRLRSSVNNPVSSVAATEPALKRSGTAPAPSTKSPSRLSPRPGAVPASGGSQQGKKGSASVTSGSIADHIGAPVVYEPTFTPNPIPNTITTPDFTSDVLTLPTMTGSMTGSSASSSAATRPGATHMQEIDSAEAKIRQKSAGSSGLSLSTTTPVGAVASSSSSAANNNSVGYRQKVAMLETGQMDFSEVGAVASTTAPAALTGEKAAFLQHELNTIPESNTVAYVSAQQNQKQKLLQMTTQRAVLEDDASKVLQMSTPRIKVMCESANLLPKYSTEESSGMDLKAYTISRSNEIVIRPHGHATIHTGLYVSIPHGYEGHIRPSQSVVKNQVSLLFTHATIDSEFKGEIAVVLKNYGDQPYTVKNGDRIAQLVISPYVRAAVEMVTELEGIRRLGPAPDPGAHELQASKKEHEDNSEFLTLPAARPVYDDTEDVMPSGLPMADHWDEEKVAASQKERRRKAQKKTLFYLLAGIVVVVIIVVLSVLLAKKNGNDNIVFVNGTASPTLSPTSAPTWEGDYVLNLLPELTTEAIFQGGTPQRQAYDWLLGDSAWKSYSDARLVQRFALATFYYATGGDEWHRGISENWVTDSSGEIGWMDYETHECSWAFSNYTGVLKDQNETWYYTRGDSPCALIKPEDSDEEEFLYEWLWLKSVGLTGTLPPEVFLLTHLRYVFLIENELTGTVSSQFGQLTNLEALALSFNKFTGTVPEELTKCSNLKALVLTGQYSETAESKMTGSVPAFLSEFQALTDIWLEEQAFTGAVPSELGLLTSLRSLRLRLNDLTSTIPTQLGQLSTLEELDLEDNPKLIGILPTEVGLLTSTKFLAFSGCTLTGSLPSELGLLTDMWKLFAAENQLTGAIPTELGLITKLEEGSIRDNLFSGQLPSELGLLSKLKWFDLYGTEITGAIPSEVGLMQSFSEIFWNNNKFSGPIPSELGLLSNAIYIDFSGNQLTSTIPVEVAQIPGLIIFNVADNELTGQVPPFEVVVSGAFADPEGPDYRSLNISGNALTGTIPSTMCSAYFHFDCSDTLCGCSCACGGNTTATTKTVGGVRKY